MNYWQSGNTDQAEWLKTSYEKQIVAMLHGIQSSKVLEIGSGLGKWGLLFSEDAYVGIEIDKSAAMYAHRKFAKDIIVSDTRYLPVRTGCFGTVFSIGVVEHFPETMQAIIEHLRACRADGKILISVPNKFTPFAIPSILRAISKRYNGKFYQAKFGSRYSAKAFLTMLKRCNCSVLSYRLIGVSLPRPFESFFAFAGSAIGAEHFFIISKELASS